jgi:hypothetical protein
VDIDSISFFSGRGNDIAWYFPNDSVYNFNTLLKRTNNNSHSKMKMVINEQYLNFTPNLRGKNVKSLPLESFPNICLGKVHNGTSFSLHLYLLGNGYAGSSSYLNNDQLKVLVAAMNAAKVMPEMADLSRTDGVCSPYYVFKREMTYLSFSAHDGTKECGQHVKNTQRDISGQAGSALLKGFWRVLQEIAFRPVEEWAAKYNEEYIKVGTHRSKMDENLMKVIAADIIDSSLLVAEAAGIKHTSLGHLKSFVVNLSNREEVEHCIQISIEGSHGQLLERLQLSDRANTRPPFSFTRIDYAVQVHPCDENWAFLPDLPKAEKMVKAFLKCKKDTLREYYRNLDQAMRSRNCTCTLF